MKKYVVAFILFMSLFMLDLPEAAADFREVGNVTNYSQLSVRSGPSATSPSIGSIKRGEFVSIVKKEGDWFYVEAKSIKGYVLGTTLHIPTSVVKIASSKGGVVVKQKPERTASTLATLTYQMVVEDFGSVGDGWSFVQYGNIVGYVRTDFIAQTKTTSKETKGSVKLRNIASKSGKEIFELPGRSAVRVHSVIAGWAYITLVNEPATRGYVETSKLAEPLVVSGRDYLPVCGKTHAFSREETVSDYTLEKYVVDFACGKNQNSVAYHLKNTSKNTSFKGTMQVGKTFGLEQQKIQIPTTFKKGDHFGRYFVKDIDPISKRVTFSIQYGGNHYADIVLRPQKGIVQYLYEDPPHMSEDYWGRTLKVVLKEVQ